jgi:hypothetical protein
MGPTKKKVHSDGLGVHAAKRLLDHVARANSAKLQAKGADFALSGGRIGSEIRIMTSPTSHAEWNDRFEWLEKQAASFLLRVPLTYSATVRWSAGRRGAGDALRLSFGLSLSLGQPLRRRFCAYVFSSGKKPQLLFSAGSAENFDRAGFLNVELLTQMPAWATKLRAEFVPMIQEAYVTYRNRLDVQGEITALAQKRKEALWYLDSLYQRSQGSPDRIYGWPPVGAIGSAAIAQEFQNCQANVLRRFAVDIEVTPLSLGVLFSS